MMKDDVKVLLKKVIPDYDIQENEEELNELLGQYLKGNVLKAVIPNKQVYMKYFMIFITASKYTVQNPQTKKMEVKLCKFFETLI